MGGGSGEDRGKVGERNRRRGGKGNCKINLINKDKKENHAVNNLLK